MKRIIILLLSLILFLTIVAYAQDIDIGAGAIDRGWYAGDTGNKRTYVSEDNPANDSGTLTSFEIWAYADITELEVATFYESGGEWYTRDNESIAGTVTAGAKRTYEISLDVESGDILGIAFIGQVERMHSGDAGYPAEGYLYESGDNIPMSGFTGWDADTAYAISVYATGTTGGTTENAIFMGMNF